MVGQLKTNNAELNINKKYAHANPISIKNQLKIIIYVGKDSTINIKSNNYRQVDMHNLTFVDNS